MNYNILIIVLILKITIIFFHWWPLILEQKLWLFWGHTYPIYEHWGSSVFCLGGADRDKIGLLEHLLCILWSHMFSVKLVQLFSEKKNMLMKLLHFFNIALQSHAKKYWKRKLLQYMACHNLCDPGPINSLINDPGKVWKLFCRLPRLQKNLLKALALLHSKTPIPSVTY